MQANRNLIITMVLCMLILAGWFWLDQQLWPRKLPKGKDAKGLAAAKVWGKLTADKFLGLTAHSAPLSTGVDAFRLASDLRGTLDPTMPLLGSAPPPPPRRQNLSDEDKQKLLAEVSSISMAALSPAIGAVAQPALWPAQSEEVVLGSKDHFIQAWFTTKGAGMWKLSATQFRAAGPLGHRTDKKLELVQEDKVMPSFLMYHYPKHPFDPRKPVPVLTLGTHLWKLEPGATPERLVFSTKVPDEDFKHITIRKTYTLGKKDYHIGLTIEVKDDRPQGSKESHPFQYQLVGAHGVPIEGEWYTSTFRNAVIGSVDSRNNLFRDLQDAARISYSAGGERVPLEHRGDSFIQYAGVMNQFFAALIVVDTRQEAGVDMKNILAWARPTLETREIKGRVVDIAGDHLLIHSDKRPFQMLRRAREYVEERKVKKGDAVVVGYYDAALHAPYSPEVDPGRPIAAWVRRGTENRPFSDDITVRVHSEPLGLKPGDRVSHKFMLYHGPVKTMLLGQFTGEKAVADELVERYTETLHLRTLTDYPTVAFAQTIRLTDLFIFITKLMHWLLNLLHWIVPNYGLAIILLTVIVRGAMFPISRRQALMSIKMQDLAPEMKKIQEKYKNDAKAKNEAVMELYRKNKVNPLGMCLPLVLQLPIFLGLYYCLQESIHFRLATFLWIDNLAAPDMLIWWGESIPWLSDPDSQGGVLYLGPYLNLLPILAVALMIVQQKLMTPPPTDEQQAMTQKMMKYMMVFFGIMFYKVAAGLCIYFIASSLWGLAERKLLPKKKDFKAEPIVKGAGKKAKPVAAPHANGVLKKVKDWWQDVLKKASKK